MKYWRGIDMKREMVLPFQGKNVKLVLNGNFCLNGLIEEVFDDCILFTTRQKTSLIRFDRIMEVTP